MRWRARRSRCPPWPTPWAPSARRSIPSGVLSRRMSWRPSACTATTRPCRCWPKAKPTPGGSGSTFATTSRSAAPGRPRRSSITRATAGASIRRLIWRATPGSCKRTLMTATTSCIWRTGSPVRSGRRRAGCMHGARSSPWPISRRMRAARLRKERDSAFADRHRGGAPHRRAVCHRALDQWPEPRGAPGGPTRLEPAFGRRSHDLHARAGGQAVARARPRQGDPVHAQALAGLHAIPRRRARLHVQQRRRAWAARRRAWADIVAILRIRLRRPARRRHVQPHCHGKDERRRSAGVARRRPLAHRRPSRASARRVAALELAASRSGRSGYGGVTMHVNKVSHVSTIDRVAKELGEHVDFLFDVALEMEPEDGVIWVQGLGDESILAFTDLGAESLVELIKIHRDQTPREKR